MCFFFGRNCSAAACGGFTYLSHALRFGYQPLITVVFACNKHTIRNTAAGKTRVESGRQPQKQFYFDGPSNKHMTLYGRGPGLNRKNHFCLAALSSLQLRAAN
jgi:hypothetical protein